MRTAFIDALCTAAATDERIWLLTGDLGYSVLEQFADRFPDRYINAGVAEQNMAGLATGLALCGKIVFIYSIANFPTFRCLEQIRNDICYHNANVKIVSVGGGLTYGTHGYSHHGVEDLAIMRVLPNMTVLAPGDPLEAALATQALAARPGPAYLRLGKAGEPRVYDQSPPFAIGQAILARVGQSLTFLTTGATLKIAMDAAHQLGERGIEARVLSLHTLKPIDTSAILAAARETQFLVTVEEHNRSGGLGSAVLEVLSDNGMGGVPVNRIGLREELTTMTGSQNYLRNHAGLSSAHLTEVVLNHFGKA